jgi:hypothetical protein
VMKAHNSARAFNQSFLASSREYTTTAMIVQALFYLVLHGRVFSLHDMNQSGTALHSLILPLSSPVTAAGTDRAAGGLFESHPRPGDDCDDSASEHQRTTSMCHCNRK